jgi:hypothetical protein
VAAARWRVDDLETGWGSRLAGGRDDDITPARASLFLLSRQQRECRAGSTARKLKAPKIFQPASSRIDGAIVQRFLDQQEPLIRYMKATAGLDLAKIIITSPVSRLVTYSLLDAYRILVTHERRHLLQARRVVERGLSAKWTF